MVAAKIHLSKLITLNVQVVDSLDNLDPNFIWVDITEMSPMPGIEWYYDGANFIVPPVPKDAGSPPSDLLLDDSQTPKAPPPQLNVSKPGVS